MTDSSQQRADSREQTVENRHAIIISAPFLQSIILSSLIGWRDEFTMKNSITIFLHFNGGQTTASEIQRSNVREQTVENRQFIILSKI
jgi:hypothetical protein